MKMSDKEPSHQDSALLFINSLQNELAKMKATAQDQHYHAEPLKMPSPSQQIRRLQNPRVELQSEHLVATIRYNAYGRPGSKKTERR
jgi:hypothetical protein